MAVSVSVDNRKPAEAISYCDLYDPEPTLRRKKELSTGYSGRGSIDQFHLALATICGK